MQPDALSATFSALADPTRRAILARLAQGETSVTELAAPFDMSLPAVTKHLKVLQRAGLVTQGRQAQWRPCRLEPAPLREVAGWVEQYRVLWEARLDRLEAYLRTLQNEEAPLAAPSGGPQEDPAPQA
ncbi:MAG: metalloregulator ArsR/SmtB family transcription factor [Rhodocyclaceae bacterium]